MRASLFVLLLSAPSVAAAHQTGPSSLELVLEPDGGARARVSLPAADLPHYLRLDPKGAATREAVERYLRGSLSVSQESGVCPQGKHSFDWPDGPSGRLQGHFHWTCPMPHGLVRVAYRAMTNDRFGYQHLGTIEASSTRTRHVFDAERDQMEVLVSPQVHEGNLEEERTSRRWRQRLPWLLLVGMGMLATMTWWWRWPPNFFRGR